MANERITENIVRQYIQKDELFTGNKIIVEEQYSENIKINKLLKNASKSGSGKGCPDLLFNFKKIQI